MRAINLDGVPKPKRQRTRKPKPVAPQRPQPEVVFVPFVQTLPANVPPPTLTTTGGYVPTTTSAAQPDVLGVSALINSDGWITFNLLGQQW